MYYPVHKKDLFFSAYPILKECGYINEPELFEKEDVLQLLSDRLSFTKEQTEDVLSAVTPFESLEELYSMFFENIDIFEKHNSGDEMGIQMPQELITETDLDDQIAVTMLKDQLDEVLGALTDRERRVLDLRYGLTDGQERTLEEVGQEFEVKDKFFIL